MKRLNNLEADHLLRLCKKYGIDSAEIDSRISYTENKLHLNGIVKMIAHTISTREAESLARASVEEREQWISEHFLDYFLACRCTGRLLSTLARRRRRLAPSPYRNLSKSPGGRTMDSLIRAQAQAINPFFLFGGENFVQKFRRRNLLFS